MAQTKAEADSTAIGLCAGPFPLPLHSQLMTQQANNNKGSTTNVRQIIMD